MKFNYLIRPSFPLCSPRRKERKMKAIARQRKDKELKKKAELMRM